MRLLRSFPILCFALVLLSIVGMSIAQRSVGLLLVAGALAAISWYVTEGPRGRSLPKWVSNVLVIAVSLNVLVDLAQNPGDILGVLGRFTLWLTIIKLYERRTARDHAQLMALSLLMMLTGCLQTVDLFFGIILIMYAALGLYVLVLYQLHAAHERTSGERLASVPPDYRLAPSLRPITGQQLRPHFRSLVLGAAVSGFALGMVIFLAFPRGIGEGVVHGFPSPHRESRPSFVEEIDLLRGGRITDSRRPVMTVRLLDVHGQPFLTGEPLLLRGAVLDRYDGQGRWRTAPGAIMDTFTGPGSFRDLVSREEVAYTDGHEDRVITQEFEILSESDTLFSIYAPVAIRTEQEQLLKLDRDSLTIKQSPDSPRLRRYSIQAAPLPSDELLDRLSPVRPMMRVYMRNLEDPVVEAMAHTILREAGVATSPPGGRDSTDYYPWAHRAAGAFTRHLHSNEFLYTTDLGGIVVPRGVDPIVHFLTDFKRGHCEYFAAALVSLCRNVGIDARLVTGYVAYEFDGANQRYNVVEANAHAWAEVRTGPHRWATFDPTPPAVLRELHEGDVGFADRLRWFYDRFDGAWGRTVVEFDSTQQARLADSGFTATMSQRLNTTLRSVRDWMDRVNRAFYLGPAGYIYMAFVGCIIVFFIIVLIKLMRRSLTITRMLHLNHLRGREYQRMVQQLGFYLDMLRVLEKAGMGKPLWQPPLLYARSLVRKNPAAAGLVRTLTDAFYAARYGRAALSRRQLAEANAAVRELAATLHVRL